MTNEQLDKVVDDCLYLGGVDDEKTEVVKSHLMPILRQALKTAYSVGKADGMKEGIQCFKDVM